VTWGEWANDHKAPVTKGKPRISGGRAVKDSVITRGDLPLCLKGRRQSCRWEKSAEAILVHVVTTLMKCRTLGRVNRPWLSRVHCLRSLRKRSDDDNAGVKPRASGVVRKSSRRIAETSAQVWTSWGFPGSPQPQP